MYKLLSYGRLFFFFNRKTLIFSHCVVSEALDHTSSSRSHTRAHAHEHPSCQSRVQPHRLLLSTQSGYLPLCTVSYSNKHQRHSDPDTFLSHAHTPAHKHTWGQCTSVGSPMAKGCKALIVFLLKEKKKKKKKQQQQKKRQNSAHRTG